MAFVLDNAINNIIEKIFDSLPAVVDETENISNEYSYVNSILTIVANITLAISLFLIIPVVRKTVTNKEELLSLFIEIPLISVKEQLECCRKFFTLLHKEEEEKKNWHTGKRYSKWSD